MNLTPINVKKNIKSVSFSSGNGYQFKTGALTSLYDAEDTERLYNATVTYGSSAEKSTIAGIYKQLGHTIRMFASKSATEPYATLTVPHGSRIDALTLETLADTLYGVWVSSSSSTSARTSLFINGYPITISVPVIDNSRQADVERFTSHLKTFIDAIGVDKLLSKNTIDVYVDRTDKIGVVFDDRIMGGELTYKIVDKTKDGNTKLSDLFTFKDPPFAKYWNTTWSMDGQPISSDTIVNNLLFGKNNCPIISQRYFTQLKSLDVYRTSSSTPNDLMRYVDLSIFNIENAGVTVNDLFRSYANPNYTYLGQSYFDGEFISDETRVIDLDFNRLPLKTMYRITGDSFQTYYTGTILIETDSQDYNTAGVASVKMSYGGGTTMQTIWSRGCGYAITIQNYGRIIYKGNTVSGSADTNNLVVSRTGGKREITGSNAWDSSTAGNITFNDSHTGLVAWTVITEQGKCYIKVPDWDGGRLVDLFEDGATRMIIPPCAWFTDTKKTSNGTTTTTRQWYYLRFFWNDVRCNAKATFKTSTTTASNKGSLAAFAAKLFFVDNPGMEGGYKVYVIRGTCVYSNKSVSDFDIEHTFTGSSDSQYTFTGMYPITAARQTGQSYTV